MSNVEPAGHDPPDGPRPAAGRSVTYCGLPADTGPFTGRGPELASIAAAAVTASRTGSVVVISGRAGAGKTSLAVHVGYLLAGQFPDRQLYLGLHAHTPGQQAVAPADALACLLAADGVDARCLPAAIDRRAALWRSRMASRRAVLILDDAAGTSQILPLLPSAPGCLVLVTGRAGLAAPTGLAVVVKLDALPAGEARCLFRRLVGRTVGRGGAAVAEAGRAVELIALSGRLPLALSLLARLPSGPRSWTLADLSRAASAARRGAGDESCACATAFALAYRQLSAGQQRFLRRLALHPGIGIDAYAAAALAGLDPEESAARLGRLHDRGLLVHLGRQRYLMHDLIREYATKLAPACDSAATRARARARLFGFYQRTAELASAGLARSPLPVAAAAPTPPARRPAVGDRDQALGWLAAERANLMACISYAAVHRQPARVIGLTAAIAADLRSHGPWPQAIGLHAAAASAARRCGDQPGLARALRDLGVLQYLARDHLAATATLSQSLAIYRGLADRPGAAETARHLGTASRLAGDQAAAAAALEDGLRICRELGDRQGEARALDALGTVRYTAGDPAGAVNLLECALRICDDLGDQLGSAQALNFLGAARYAVGDLAGATTALERALVAHRKLGSRIGEANVLTVLYGVRYLSGDHRGASAALTRQLRVFRELGNQAGEAEALRHAAALHLARGRQRPARGLYQRAADLARAIGDRQQEASALDGIARCARRPGTAPRHDVRS